MEGFQRAAEQHLRVTIRCQTAKQLQHCCIQSPLTKMQQANPGHLGSDSQFATAAANASQANNLNAQTATFSLLGQQLVQFSPSAASNAHNEDFGYGHSGALTQGNMASSFQPTAFQVCAHGVVHVSRYLLAFHQDLVMALEVDRRHGFRFSWYFARTL